MMIRDMFADDINRKINGVIKVDQAADDVIEQELNEYVITRELKKHFITFFNYYGDAFDRPTADMGVWISGFFGSGKSHFLKMLSYLLENKEVKGIRSVERFRKKFEDDPATFMLIDRATKGTTETILFNIDIEGFSNKDKTAVLRVFAKMFYNHLGYYGENLKVAMLERYIDQQGKTEEFCRVFEEKKGKSWLEMRRAFAFNGKFIIPTLMEVEVQKENIGSKWFPCNKGGTFRRWYGNKDYLIDWENNGFALKNFTDIKTGKLRSTLRNIDFNFLPSVVVGHVASGDLPFRYVEGGFISESAVNSIYPLDNEVSLIYLLGILNSKSCNYISKMLSPTLGVSPEDILNIPIVVRDESIVSSVVKNTLAISKIDWDSFETSWDFQCHSLLRKVPTISEAFDQWQAECDDRFNQLKANEEELNRIFIDIYGLQDELTPEVEDKDVTVRKADLGRDIRSFISYAVGCMFGRYSLDVDGLAYAGGEWDASKYASFAADKDNIIPICEDEYFEDDIVGLFVEFVKTVYGADTLDENLKFIADALGGKGQPKDVIRNYFLSDFYSDHCKMYQKRPIYWLFDSGKKNGFKALIYMQRYQPDTIARIRTDYVHEQQARYRTAIADLEQRIANVSTGERVKLNKKLTTLQAQDTEIRTYEEKIHHLADQMISIDLDDGVKKNYAIFQDVLAKIK